MGNDRKQPELPPRATASSLAGQVHSLGPDAARLNRPSRKGPAGRVRDWFTLAAILAVGVAIYLGLIARGTTWPFYVLLVGAAPLLMLAAAQVFDWLFMPREQRAPARDAVQKTTAEPESMSVE